MEGFLLIIGIIFLAAILTIVGQSITKKKTAEQAKIKFEEVLANNEFIISK